MSEAAPDIPVEVPCVDGADAFEAWLGQAQRGERVVYAIAREFPRATACGILAQSYLRQQLIVTVFQRMDDGTTQFIAERTAKSVIGAGTSLRRGSFDRLRMSGVFEGEDEEQMCDAILRLIKRCANFALPAPSLRDMAKAAGLADSEAGRAAARRALAALSAAGHVRHENSQDGNQRRFILPGGKKTGWLFLRGNPK